MRYSQRTADKFFYVDVERMGRWHIYATRNSLNPVGLQKSISAETSDLLQFDESSFGKGSEYVLTLRKGRRVTYAGDASPVSPIGVQQLQIGMFVWRPVDEWYPAPLDLIFEVDWNVKDEYVPEIGRPKMVTNIYEVSQARSIYEDRDRLVYWHTNCNELGFNRVRLTQVLMNRWPETARDTVYKRA